MRDAVREQYDAFPDPSPSLVPIGSSQLDRMDDGLHFGWSWHRYRYAYRRSDALRILDAGCGTGLTTLTLARLNPGSTVIGLDASAPSLDLAKQRLAVARDLDVSFLQHDLETPMPGGLGPFDFIVCRRVLGQVDDPGVILKHLSRGLDHRGLILATFPARGGR
ncbi:MAG: class I SAM-dependent methyltransferase, partial [Isosphaeraceae bacterium]